MKGRTCMRRKVTRKQAAAGQPGAAPQPQGRRAGQLASARVAAAANAGWSVREHAAAPSSHGQLLVLQARWLAWQAG